MWESAGKTKAPEHHHDLHTQTQTCFICFHTENLTPSSLQSWNKRKYLKPWCRQNRQTLAHTFRKTYIHSYRHTLWLCTEEPYEISYVRGKPHGPKEVSATCSSGEHVCECAHVVRKTWRDEVECVHRFTLKTVASAYTSYFLYYSFVAAEEFSFTMFINFSVSQSRSCYGRQYKSFKNLNKSISTVF